MDFCAEEVNDFGVAVIEVKDLDTVVYKVVDLVFDAKRVREKIVQVFGFDGVNRVNDKNFVNLDAIKAEENIEKKPIAILYDLDIIVVDVAKADLSKAVEEN